MAHAHNPSSPVHMTPAPGFRVASAMSLVGAWQVVSPRFRNAAWYAALGWGTLLALYWLVVAFWYIVIIGGTLGLALIFLVPYRSARRRQRRTDQYRTQQLSVSEYQLEAIKRLEKPPAS